MVAVFFSVVAIGTSSGIEPVTCAVAGALILGTRMTGREYLGCALMLAAVVLAQLPYPLGRKAVQSGEAFGDGQEV